MKLVSLIILIITITFFSSLNAKTYNLTANEVFFSPAGKLRTKVDPNKAGDEFNGHPGEFKYMDYVYKWIRTTDTLVWGLKIQGTGTVTINPIMSVATNQNESVIEISMGNQVKTIIVQSSASLTTFKKQGSVTFNLPNTETALINIRIKTLKKADSQIGYLKSVEIIDNNDGIKEVFKRRWRPLSVHIGRWLNSSSPNSVTITVHENTVITPNESCYMPISTPYGYSGTTWNVNTKSFRIFNFSLWSFSKGATPPPYTQWSHLIAVDQGLIFGRFDHEGTGVKPKDPGSKNVLGPWIKKSGLTTQIIATRQEPGVKFNTYWAYYLDPDTMHWKLFACGKRYNKSGKITYPTNGAFIEIPGPPYIERSGHKMRRVEYRGWMMDKSGKWYTIDKIPNQKHNAKLSYKNWGITSDGKRFFMETGGFLDKNVDITNLKLTNPTPVPEYLKGAYLDELFALPAQFSTISVDKIGGDRAEIKITMKDVGTNPDAYICWGKKDGLTDSLYWDSLKKINLKNGSNAVSLTGLEKNTNYFYRVRVLNNEGTSWMMESGKFKTTNESTSVKKQLLPLNKNNFLLVIDNLKIPLHLNLKESCSINLYKLNGQHILGQRFSSLNKNSYKISRNSIPKGVYLLQIGDGVNFENNLKIHIK